MKSDLCDQDIVNELVKEVIIIVYFVVKFHIDRNIEWLFLCIRTNIEETLFLLKAAKQNRRKIVHHISTDEIFDFLSLNKLKMKFTTKIMYNSRSPYFASNTVFDHFVIGVLLNL